MTEDDWNGVVQDIDFHFVKDSYFTELKDSEILKERLEALQQMDEYIGKYYSIEYIRRNILRQNDDEMKIIDSQIKQEKDAGLHGDEDEDQF